MGVLIISGTINYKTKEEIETEYKKQEKNKK